VQYFYQLGFRIGNLILYVKQQNINGNTGPLIKTLVIIYKHCILKIIYNAKFRFRVQQEWLVKYIWTLETVYFFVFLIGFSLVSSMKSIAYNEQVHTVSFFFVLFEWYYNATLNTVVRLPARSAVFGSITLIVLTPGFVFVKRAEN